MPTAPTSPEVLIARAGRRPFGRLGRVVLVTLLCAGSAVAQPAQAPIDATPAPADRPDCQSAPPGAVPPDRTLTETLRACGGALAPPASGDGEIAKPPPEGSRTPVIRPQQPSPPGTRPGG